MPKPPSSNNNNSDRPCAKANLSVVFKCGTTHSGSEVASMATWPEGLSGAPSLARPLRPVDPEWRARRLSAVSTPVDLRVRPRAPPMRPQSHTRARVHACAPKRRLERVLSKHAYRIGLTTASSPIQAPKAPHLAHRPLIRPQIHMRNTPATANQPPSACVSLARYMWQGMAVGGCFAACNPPLAHKSVADSRKLLQAQPPPSPRRHHRNNHSRGVGNAHPKATSADGGHCRPRATHDRWQKRGRTTSGD